MGRFTGSHRCIGIKACVHWETMWDEIVVWQHFRFSEKDGQFEHIEQERRTGLRQGPGLILFYLLSETLFNRLCEVKRLLF